MLGSMAFKVTCTGKISGAARAKLGEKGIKVVLGGSGPSGRRYTLRPVKAKDAEAAVNKAKAAVEAAGGFCSFFTASDDYSGELIEPLWLAAVGRCMPLLPRRPRNGP